jgi:hypothetical protein
MAGGGYRGILAAVPTAQNLRSAFRWGGASRSKTKRGGLIADLMSVKIIGGGPLCHARQKSNCGSEPAREGGLTFNIDVD